jgi:hypothetical protein
MATVFGVQNVGYCRFHRLVRPIIDRLFTSLRFVLVLFGPGSIPFAERYSQAVGFGFDFWDLARDSPSPKAPPRIGNNKSDRHRIVVNLARTGAW